jgi:hypothetical protein
MYVQLTDPISRFSIFLTSSRQSRVISKNASSFGVILITIVIQPVQHVSQRHIGYSLSQFRRLCVVGIKKVSVAGTRDLTFTFGPTLCSFKGKLSRGLSPILAYIKNFAFEAKPRQEVQQFSSDKRLSSSR